jgi:regulator of protease activity HflC (stomatin/prohibitin superfamily)
MNNINLWKLGWVIARKLVYYVLVIVGFTVGVNFAFTLMTIANTFAFLGGMVLLVTLISIGIALLVREILFYAKKVSKHMKKITSLLIAVATIAFVTGCTRIEPGYVGIKVNMAGSDKGVEEYPIQTGWVFYNPITTKVFDYPTFQQNVVWYKENSKNSPGDESISFNCDGGAQMNADIAASFKFYGTNVPKTFVKFRSDPETIIHTYIRNEVRDVLQRLASKEKAMDILGSKKSEFLDKVKAELNVRLHEHGEFEYLTFSRIDPLDKRITDAINANIQQIQETLKAEQKVLQVKAEADQAAAQADGARRVKIAMAEGDAESIRVKAVAQSNANAMVRASLSPEVLQSIALDKWNGTLPTVTGGTIPFINITAPAK